MKIHDVVLNPIGRSLTVAPHPENLTILRNVVPLPNSGSSCPPWSALVLPAPVTPLPVRQPPTRRSPCF